MLKFMLICVLKKSLSKDCIKKKEVLSKKMKEKADCVLRFVLLLCKVKKKIGKS